MNPITCYAQPEKIKSQRVLEAFAAGCGGRMSSTWAARLEAGAAAFYGVRPGWMHLWDQAKSEGREFWYLDNSWFDTSRERYFRVGRNALQTWSRAQSDGKRLKALGVRVKPWRTDGRHIVVAAQSLEFMRTLAGQPQWPSDVMRAIEQRTDRQILVRAKGCARPLAADLSGAWLLVAHSSAAAVEGLLAGVPVITTDPDCAMSRFSSRFEEIECPRTPDGREEWAAQLADSQWTLGEFRSGEAWRAINA
jgi:hypothetical protein